MNARYQARSTAGTLDDARNSAASAITESREEMQAIHTGFEAIRSKVDAVLELREQLDSFLEIDKPFQALRGEAESLRTQVESTTEQVSRMRDQQNRLSTAVTTANSKIEALDRRRDELGRSLADKERRVTTVDQAVRGMDGIANRWTKSAVRSDRSRHSAIR
jgi:chromosome segregation ATPase